MDPRLRVSHQHVSPPNYLSTIATLHLDSGPASWLSESMRPKCRLDATRLLLHFERVIAHQALGAPTQEIVVRKTLWRGALISWGAPFDGANRTVIAENNRSSQRDPRAGTQTGPHADQGYTR